MSCERDVQCAIPGHVTKFSQWWISGRESCYIWAKDLRDIVGCYLLLYFSLCWEDSRSQRGNKKEDWRPPNPKYNNPNPNLRPREGGLNRAPATASCQCITQLLLKVT
jgi:hypothetical protein